MTLSKRWQSSVVASVLLFLGQSAEAVVLYGNDTGGTTDNTVAPTNGAPWNYVARIDENNASGVYLGNGYVLTANHVTGPLASASINGSVYAIDQSYVPLQIGGADIKLLRIIGDPGLAPLALMGSKDDDTGKGATFIGWGVGKGSEIRNQGWNWGDDSTQLQRWGENTTNSSYVTSDGFSMLATAFNRSGGFGEDEFSLSLGDSGGGLFIKYGNTWKLAGIAAGVEISGQALYDKDPVALFDQPGISVYTPVKLYRDAIISAIPEPSTGCLGLAGAAALLGRMRLRRNRG